LPLPLHPIPKPNQNSNAEVSTWLTTGTFYLALTGVTSRRFVTTFLSRRHVTTKTLAVQFDVGDPGRLLKNSASGPALKGRGFETRRKRLKINSGF
jgi:hypothetical protein